MTFVLVDIGDPSAVPLEVGKGASFAPSGNAIVFNPSEAPDTIRLRNLIDGRETEVGAGRLPQICSDLKFVLALREPIGGVRENNHDIVVIDRDNNRERVIAQGHSPHLMPDGFGVAYLRDYSNEFCFVSIDGTKQIAVDLPRGPKTRPVFCASEGIYVVATLPTGPIDQPVRLPHDAFIIDTSDWTTKSVSLEVDAKQ